MSTYNDTEWMSAIAVKPRVTGSRILLVDDESVLRELIQRYLAALGHTVHAVANGRDAARWLADHAVELVITDLCMPDADGMELMMELKRRGSRVPILVISGGVRGEIDVMLRAATLLGASRTLAKPFPLTDLAAVVGEMLGEV